MVDKIPPVVSADAEDVVWALQTADALWRRGERVDAIVWVRRAAQAAGVAENDERALELARDAGELTELLASENVANRRTVSDHPRAQADIDDLLASAPNEPLYYTPAPPMPPMHGGAEGDRESLEPPLSVHVQEDYSDDADNDVVTSAPPLALQRPAPSRAPAARSDLDDIDDLLVTAANPIASDPPNALNTLPPVSMDEIEVYSVPPPAESVAPPAPPSAMRAPPPLPGGMRIPAPPPLPRAGVAPSPPASVAAGGRPPPVPAKSLPSTRHAPPPRFTLGRPASGTASMPASPPQAAPPAPLAAPPTPPRASAPSSSSMFIASPAHAYAIPQHQPAAPPTPEPFPVAPVPSVPVPAAPGSRASLPLPPAALPPPPRAVRFERAGAENDPPVPPHMRPVQPPQATVPDTFFPPATPPPPRPPTAAPRGLRPGAAAAATASRAARSRSVPPPRRSAT